MANPVAKSAWLTAEGQWFTNQKSCGTLQGPSAGPATTSRRRDESPIKRAVERFTVASYSERFCLAGAGKRCTLTAERVIPETVRDSIGRKRQATQNLHGGTGLCTDDGIRCPWAGTLMDLWAPRNVGVSA